MSGFTVDSFMTALGQVESGGNYTAKSSSSTASGKYQYLDSTWNNYGGYAHAWQAPPSVQDARARRDITSAYSKYGSWEKVAAAHFAGGGWVAAHPDMNAWGVNPVPGSSNPTVADYVSRVFQAASMKTSAVPTGASVGSSSPTASAKDITSEVEKNYGYLAAYLKDPEIGPILVKAAQKGWDSATLQGAIYKTKWWKTHSDATRTFDAQGRLDPATQKAQIASQLANLSTEARNLGLIMDPKRLSQMAVDSLRFGWSGQQVRNALVNEGKFDFTGKTGSAALTLRDNLKTKAEQYLVPVADKTMQQWVKNVTKGDVSEQDFDGYLKEQAKSLFPGLAAAIDRGVTVEQYADPYRQIAAQTLEIDPQQINFLQPKWNKALQQVDPKTGQRTSMSLSDWQNTIRTDASYGYDKTDQAKQAASNLTTQLAQSFGSL